jgi:lysozyme
MKIKEIIKEHEGFRNQVYVDTLGYRTIGYGHKVTKEDNFEDDKVYDKELLEEVFDNDFGIARRAALRLTEHLDIADDAIDVITSMVFQLGEAGVSKFRNMFEALEIPDYGEAAEQMLDSKWHMQTPNRCQELANIMRNCGL